MVVVVVGGTVVVTSVVVVVVSRVLAIVDGTEEVSAVSGSAAQDPTVKINTRITANRLMFPSIRLASNSISVALDLIEHMFDIV